MLDFKMLIKSNWEDIAILMQTYILVISHLAVRKSNLIQKYH